MNRKQQLWIMLAMVCGLSMTFIDQTAPAVALPQIQKDLSMSNIGLQWVINAYLVATAAFIIFGGRVADLYGRKRFFIVGLIIFSLASISSALAQSEWWIIFSRALQGIGSAFIIPATSSIMFNTFDEAERGKMIGMYVGISAIFLSLGPVLGGLLTHYLSWRWVYWINFPIALIGITIASRFVPKDEKSVKRHALDFPGFILFSVMLTSLVFGLMEGARAGWTSTFILAIFGLSIGALLLFIYHEKNTENPLVDLHLFKNSYFTRPVILLLILQTATSCIIFWPMLLQNGFGLNASLAGLAMLPMTIPITFMAPIGGRIRDRFGPRLPAMIGMCMIILAAVDVAYFAQHRMLWMLLPGFLLFGCGMPFVISSCMVTALSNVDPKKRGVGSGLTSASRQLGSSLGIAIIGTTITMSNQHYLSNWLKNTTGQIATLHVKQISSVFSSQGKNSFLSILSKGNINVVYEVARRAFMHAFSSGMYAVVLLALFGLLIAWQLPKRLNR